MLIYCNWTGYCCTIILYCTSDTLCLHFICSFPFYILLITLFTAYIYTMMAFAFVLDRVGRGHIRISHSHPGLASTVFDSLWAQAYGLYEVYTRSQAEYSCLVSRSLFGFGFRLAKGSFASHAVYNIHCLICLRWFQCRLMIDEYFKSWHADCSSWSFQFYILNPNSNPCMYPFHSIRFNRLIRELIGNIIATKATELISTVQITTRASPIIKETENEGEKYPVALSNSFRAVSVIFSLMPRILVGSMPYLDSTLSRAIFLLLLTSFPVAFSQLRRVQLAYPCQGNLRCYRCCCCCCCCC